MTTKHKYKCPECQGANFGAGSGEPVTANGWYGDKRFEWGHYAGVRVIRLTARRCRDCGHVEHVDPEWD
jgi:hypothetical protein